MMRRTFLAMVMAMAMAGLTTAAFAGEGHDHGKRACKCAECKECANCKAGKCAECTKACCKPTEDKSDTE